MRLLLIQEPTIHLIGPDGAVFKVVLPHSSSYNPASVDSIKVIGTPSYTNLATTSAGIDVSMGVYSYNGNFIQPSITYPVRTWNVGGLGADSVEVTFEYKQKNITHLFVIWNNFLY